MFLTGELNAHPFAHYSNFVCYFPAGQLLQGHSFKFKFSRSDLSPATIRWLRVRRCVGGFVHPNPEQIQYAGESGACCVF